MFHFARYREASAYFDVICSQLKQNPRSKELQQELQRLLVELATLQEAVKSQELPEIKEAQQHLLLSA